ncbi:MAG: hypothetical protein K0R43_3474 [Pseudoduganella sp.]|jgi:hypothetical protein|nr:hypothetical protein [Pseudoduganella sp.]
MKMRLGLVVAAILAVAALAGCTKPIPPERAAYVGEWRGKQMDLSISKEGTVIYKRQEGSTRTSVNAPLKEFEGDNFVVGVGPMKTTFVVSAPPHQDAGKWMMTVDGVELTRVE